ncbi:MAG: MoaD/ThiS family protein [Verrucomicrobia bacterium]|nr:MoaD/ThiS family protein [Verrucomicrobiota bacterium]MBV9644911.1 MoaD/ThiS family protein [Verrucomicrobiota bacterium]
MLIQIQYFGQLRSLGGPHSIELDEGTTVEGLLNKLFQQTPSLALWNKHLLIAVGTDWVQRDHVVKLGDMISLMPPVQGG